MAEGLEKLREMRERSRQGGGKERIEQQHAKGKLTARERLALLLDPNSFLELGDLAMHDCRDFGMAERRYPGDSVVTGLGKVDGREVAVFAQDFTVLGGSFSEVHARKVCQVMDLALSTGVPVIGLNDSGGARIQEGVRSLAGYAELFTRNTLASGVVPQISVMMGPCAGGSVYSPALTDFVIMVEGISSMFITGPDVIRTVTGEEVGFEELGGAAVHGTRSGVAHFVVADEPAALNLTRRLLSYLPSNNMEDPPAAPSKDPPKEARQVLNRIIPGDPSQPYDVKEVIRWIFDPDSFLEVHSHFAPNAVVGFARLRGRAVGVVAQQPMVLAGALDIDASDKIARFVRFCDAFHFPLVTLVDSPGFLPGMAQEHGGIIRHGAKIVYAYAEATVPKVSVVLRKAYGGAYIVLSSKYVRTDVTFAWPTAEIAVIGPEGAVDIVYRRDLAASPNPQALRQELVAAYQERFATPYAAAESGHIDTVIEPGETRERVAAALIFLWHKQDTNPPKKHGIMPV
ncbi:MAG: acyl-CoA carboxylase subunit beta [Anaerolineae bacterium]